MVIRQPLAAPPFMRRTPPRRLRATTLAVSSSIAVHLAIGAYLINSTFHPFNLPTQVEPPPMVIQDLTLPPKPVTPAQPLTPPHIQPHAPAGPIPSKVDTLPARPLSNVRATDIVSNTPGTFGDGLTTILPQPPTAPTPIANPDWLTRPDAHHWPRPTPTRQSARTSAGR